MTNVLATHVARCAQCAAPTLLQPSYDDGGQVQYAFRCTECYARTDPQPTVAQAVDVANAAGAIIWLAMPIAPRRTP